MLPMTMKNTSAVNIKFLFKVLITLYFLPPLLFKRQQLLLGASQQYTTNRTKETKQTH